MIKSRGEQKVGRNPFDLTNRHVYTQKAAKIIPVKALHTMPDDYFEVDMQEFSQNNIPMNTAAFLTGKKEMLAYFVPYNTVWHNYNQYQATREDPESTLLKDKGISFEPRINLRTLYRSALYFSVCAWLVESWSDLYAIYKWQQDNGAHYPSDMPWNANTEMTLSSYVDYLKNSYNFSATVNDYDYYKMAALNLIRTKKFSTFSSGGYPLSIYHDCYENYVLHDADLTVGDSCLDMFNTPIWCDWVRKLDMLGYGNIWPIVKIMRDKLDKLVSDVFSNTQIYLHKTRGLVEYTDGSTHEAWTDFDDLYIDSVWLDYDFDPDDEETPNFWYNPVLSAKNKIINMVRVSNDHDEYVNVYPLYSYNKCFYDYMRNSYFDLDYSVYNYNCDFVSGSSFEDSIIHDYFIPCRFYWIESHQWKKDLFTGVLPDNQLGAVSSVVLDAGALAITNTVTGSPTASSLGLSVGSPLYPHDGTSASLSSVVSASGNFPWQGSNLASKAFPNEVSTDFYAVDNNGEEVQIRTPHFHSVVGEIATTKGDLAVTSAVSGGNNMELNVLALKRAEAIQQYRQDLMRAGNRTKDIFQQIYGVTPKSQLDETPYFIDVASQDINVNPIIATAQTDAATNGKLGSIAARSTISGGALQFKFSTKDFGVVLFLSYIIPESMYNSTRLDPFVTHLDPESHGLPYFQNLGLQPVIGEFLCNLQNKDVRHRVLGYAPPYIERKTDIDLVHGSLVDCYLPSIGSGDVDAEYQGELSHWVVARTDMQQENAVSLRNFYIDPRILNNIFQFEAGSDYSTYHFLTYSDIKVNAVRAISEIGLPRF